MQRALCYATLPSMYAELASVAARMRAEWTTTCTFVLDQDAEEAALRAARDGFPALQARGLPAPDRADLQALAPSVEREVRKLEDAAPEGARDDPSHRLFRAELPEAVARLVTARERAHLLIRELDPELLIVGEDYHVGLEHALVVEARQRGIPVVCYAYDFDSRAYVSHWFRTRPDSAIAHGLHSPWNAHVVQVWPKWRHDWRDHRVIPERTSMIVAAHLLSLDPRLPWCLGGGEPDLILVASEAFESFYARQGTPREPMRVTGKIYHDDLWDLQKATRVRQDLLRNLQIPEDLPLLVYSVPAEQAVPPGDPTPYWGYASRIEAVERVCHEIVGAAEGRAGLLLSIHPRAQPQEHAFLEALPHVRIAPKRISELIPHADLFVSGMSSTIAQALACGRPVLHTHIYDFPYELYDDAAALVDAGSPEALGPTVRDLLTPGRREELATKAAHESDRWGRIDGRAAERILEAITSVLPGR